MHRFVFFSDFLQRRVEALMSAFDSEKMFEQYVFIDQHHGLSIL